MFTKSKALLKLLMVFTIMFASFMVGAQVNTGGQANTKNHRKQIIGYITQWDAWKDSKAGLTKGALTQLNIDYSKYTILNYSFFGVAVDGSLHSGDFRNKKIWQKGVVQQPADLFMTDIYSSWDLYIMFGEVEPVHYINQDIANRAKAQGFEVTVGGAKWSNPSWGIYNKGLPLPLKKEGGAKGLMELAKANNVKLMASIGGWSMCKHFPEMAADATKRAKFIEECKKLIGMGFDGIDLDWEYPGFLGMNIENHGPADFKNFEILVKEIRAAIGPNKLITSATSADPRKLRGYNWAEIDKYMDYYNMMTYDFGGGWSGKASHNANVHRYTGAEVAFFSWDDCLAELKAQKIPLNKVNFGIPFYGRGVICDGVAALNAPTLKKKMNLQPDGDVSSAMDKVNFEAYDGTPNYEFVRQKTGFGTKNGWTKHWDSEAMVPYVTNGKYFLSYDDEESVAYKAQYIKNNNMAGTIVWTVYGDLEFGGTAQSFGSKLKRWSNVKSPLINKVNEVFAKDIIIKDKPVVTAPATVEVKLGAEVVINASATDKDGQVVKMEAKEGTTLLASSTNGSLVVRWTPAAKGTYSVVVSATDNDNQTSSATVTVVVTDGGGPVQSAPVVKITAPANNSKIVTDTTATIEVVANVTDVDGDLKTVALDTVKPAVAGDVYTFTIANVAPGTYTFKVVATDAGGRIGEATVTVEVVKNGVCNLPAWDPAKTYKGGEVVCHNKVHYKALWWHKGSEPGKSQWGPWEKVGDCGTNPGNKAPTVSISSPAANASFKAPANVEILAVAKDSDGTVAKVEVFQGAKLLGTATAGTNGRYTFALTALAKGTYSYKVVATDDKGATGEATVTVTVTDGNTNPNKAWAPNVPYRTGDIVTYSGKTYKCVFAHTSLIGWEPSKVPTLWQLQ